MKKTIRNFEIENILTVLNHKDSFRNDISVKLPKAVRQALRINLKTLADRMEIFEEERKEIYSRYSTDEKAEKQEDGNFKVKPEYMNDLYREITELMAVQNDLEIETVDLSAFDNVSLSSPEEDVLEFLFGKEEVEKVEGEVE